MKAWRSVLVLLLLAIVMVLGWYWLSADPGYVQVRMRDTTIETSVVVALAALLTLWAVVTVLWRLVRWPFRAWGRSVKRRGRERLASGLTAFAEGEYAQAERELGKAATHEAFRTPALLVAARAAHECGAEERATQALDEVGPNGSRAADALRARFLIENGRGAEALGLLKSRASANSLSPRGWRLLVECALAADDTETAMQALPALARSQSLTGEAQAALETRVLGAALRTAPDTKQLNTLWRSATRAQRQRVELVAAYARRAAALGQTLGAMDEIEAAQRRDWSEELATIWGELGDDQLATRSRKAEAWLGSAPNSPALLATLGRFHVEQAQWANADDVLERSLALEETPRAWEIMGDARKREGDSASAATCYANALRVARGQKSQPVGPRRPVTSLDTRSIAFEERSELGVPRLPGVRQVD